MTAKLSTQLLRSLSALPLLAVCLAAAAGARPEAATATAVAAGAMVAGEIVVVARPAGGGGDTPFAVPVSCGQPIAAAGAAALARVPGDLGPIAARVRCAQ